MRFVHVADSHVGYRSGHPDRAGDFRDAFSEAIDRTLELSPDAFVHAGDLFHGHRPSNNDMVFVARELMRLIREGIEVILTPGNHDKMKIRGEVAPQSVLELMGAKVFGFTDDKLCYTVKGVEFWGLPYMDRKDDLLGFISKMGERANSPAVLVLHQYIYPPASHIPYLYHQDMPSVFSYCALGHWHLPWNSGRFVYPGSPEPTELSLDQAEVRRGFYLVEIGDKDKVKMEPQLFTKTRPFFYLDCREEDLVKEMEKLRERIFGEGKRPMLRIRVSGGPDMRANELVDSAIYAAGMKREDFLLVNVIPERNMDASERVLSVGEYQGEAGHEDMIGRFFGDDPRLFGLVTTMRDAIVRAETERESSGTQAKTDRQVFIEAAKKAAQEHLLDPGKK